MRVIQERQLGHPTTNICGVGQRCKHGHPQAFAFDPIGREAWHPPGQEGGSGKRKSRLESGMFRLSCPLLVKAVDEWEGEGAVKEINAQVLASAQGQHEEPSQQQEPQQLPARERLRRAKVYVGPNLASMLEEAHGGHAAARHELLGERLDGLLEEAEADGEEAMQTVKHVLESGIAGQTRTKTDIKCVHAQLADGLCRDNTNGVANELLKRLEEKGTPVRGDESCAAQCNLHLSETEARRVWWYEPMKNKWKLRKKLQRRKRNNAARRAEQQAVEAAAALGFEGEEARIRDLDRAAG